MLNWLPSLRVRLGAVLNTDDDIMASVVHMSMNRLFGVDPDRERK